MDKREFLKTGALAGAAVLATGAVSAFAAENINGFKNAVDANGEYVLPALPYAYDALEPHIDAQTMKLHHDIHHAGYVKGVNAAAKKIGEATMSGDFGSIKHLERDLAFNGSGHFLHTIFWNVMGPKQGKRSGQLEAYITKSFGSYQNFEKLYKSAAGAVEGSGWGILAYEPVADRLVVLQAEKHQNLTQWITVPILPIDVWEHAYYLKYQNKRGDYVSAFMEVVNWSYVSEQFDKILKMYK